MNSFREIDWPLLLIWGALSSFGLVAIYSATQGPVSHFLPDYIQQNFFRQTIWVAVSLIIIALIQFIPPRTFQGLAYPFYLLTVLMMIITVFFGVEVSGSQSWLRIGALNLQTAEIMKLATILAAANYLTSQRNVSAQNFRTAFTTLLFFIVPVGLLLMQNEAGIAVIFLALLPFMLFWAGLPHAITLFMISPAIIAYLSIISLAWGITASLLIGLTIFLLQKRSILAIASVVIGLLCVAGTEILLHQVLQPHQASRIEAFVNPDLDPRGSGWNIIQATTAIGSGGISGKGFLEGTQTQLRFLPEQWTDFIFCVIGEEFGFIGASLILLFFLFLFLRLLHLGYQHQHPFAQLFMVAVASVFFIHFVINIGSSTAVMPVIGLPLPFISYGGSAFLTNSILIGICLNLDLYKRSLSIYH
ncbi:MAG: rod shape-determining protein RodA [Balneolaceae bacterium]